MQLCFQFHDVVISAQGNCTVHDVIHVQKKETGYGPGGNGRDAQLVMDLWFAVVTWFIGTGAGARILTTMSRLHHHAERRGDAGGRGPNFEISLEVEASGEVLATRLINFCVASLLAHLNLLLKNKHGNLYCDGVQGF